MKGTLVALFLLASLIYATSAVNSNYPTIQTSTLKKQFDAAKPYSDLSNAFYSINGNSLLGENLPQQSLNDVCNFIKSKVDKTSVESIYYATSLAAKISGCTLPTADFKETLDRAAGSQRVPDLFYYTFAALSLKQPIDSKKISKNVLDGLKLDTSIINQAYSLQIAAQLASENQKVFYDTIEDILDQADEVDKKYLQYEGGVGTTSLVLDGIFELSTKSKQLPAKLTQDRLAKFVNYLTSKRFPTNIKSAFYLLKISLTLSDNQFSIPLIVNRLSSVSLSANQPNVLVGLTNILGNPVKQVQFNVEAESAKNQKQQNENLISGKKALTAKSSDGSTFELKLIEGQQQAAASAGFYTLALSASPKAPANADKRFFLVVKTVEVKLTTQVSLVDLQIGVADRDTSAPKLTKLEENKSLESRLEADQQTKFFLKFNLKDKLKANQLIEAHQVFIRFTHVKTGRDIVFLALPSSAKQYAAEVDFSTNAKNFRQMSGAYTIELIVSDSLIENPIKFKVGDINLAFSEDQSANVAASIEDKASLYAKKPEIKHLFRQPEPVPPTVVSTFFSALCLAPLGLLLILWLKIGFNFSKFSFSLSGLVFHITIAAIFGLFYCYWTHLNMFSTIRYLTILALVALVTGNKLLKGLASIKEKKN
jgi:oligosaccharyltransferase complex subunit delta (ribophorin II)